MNFSEVGKEISILCVVKNEVPGKVYHVGAAFRCDPCPLCGHRGCFTIYEQKNYVRCFSCGFVGDSIDLVQAVQGLTNVEALDFLIKRYGHKRYDRRAYDVNSTSVFQKDDRLSDEKRTELCRIRRIAAEFYHDQLMKNQEALNYQTDIRRHSITVIEKLQVGYTEGSLITHCKDKGVNPRSMVETGLVRENRGIIRDYYPRNCFVYPHFSDDKILFFTMKDPSGKLKFQIPKRFADPSWVCLGQDSLNADGCWLCEGENDFISLHDAGEANAAATIGNFCTPEVTGWLKENAAGKLYYLAFDADDAGAKYVAQYSKVIFEAGGRVSVVHV